MITGLVNSNREATIRLAVRSPGGRVSEVEAIIDTGFDGFITLPPALVAALGLRRLSRGRATLANGQEVLFDIYGSTVIWDGVPRHVETDAVDAPPLVGMSLLHDHELHIHVVDGGRVLINKAPA